MIVVNQLKNKEEKKGSDKVHCVTSGDQVAYCHSNGLCHAKENKKKKKQKVKRRKCGKSERTYKDNDI